MHPAEKILEIVAAHERKSRRSFSLIPSENLLSPAARLAFLSDAVGRYYFDELASAGIWIFPGGSIIGDVQREILVPTLRRLGCARFVDVHAVSGLTGMTLSLGAFGGKPSSTILSVPVTFGGHASTSFVARQLGLVPEEIPFADWATVDLDGLADVVGRTQPSLVYVDHATAIVPLDLAGLVRAARSAARSPVHVHVDTSHVNGLIWGGALPNPLDLGADSYGGSTHKTFPGPHKAAIFTNSEESFARLQETALHTISHHHMADVIAFAVGAAEFELCGGAEYASQVVRNARAFAQALAGRGHDVQHYGGEHTRTHQVWAGAPQGWSADEAGARLYVAGLVVNPYCPLPSLGSAGIRMGFNEATRLGIREDGAAELARLYDDALSGARPVEAVAEEVASVRAPLRPMYCLDREQFDRLFASLCGVVGADGIGGFLYG